MHLQQQKGTQSQVPLSLVLFQIKCSLLFLLSKSVGTQVMNSDWETLMLYNHTLQQSSRCQSSPYWSLIISTASFIYPFIVSKSTLPYIYIINADLYVPQVSQLILNLLEANCPLDESIDSGTMESLRFRHTESNRDSETDILWGDRITTFVGEGIHEEARWWTDLALFISIDDDRCRWHCCFRSSPTTWLESCSELSKKIDTNKTGK